MSKTMYDSDTNEGEWAKGCRFQTSVTSYQVSSIELKKFEFELKK